MNTPLTKSLTKGHFFLQLESHVFGSHRPVPQDVYARLKALEERVLFLEGVSPEYFSVTTNLLKSSQCDGDDDDNDSARPKESDAEAIASLSAINKRIQELRSNLVTGKVSVKMEL